MLAVFACTENSATSSSTQPEDNTPFGWLEGGFTPEISADRGGGLQKISHSGNWLVLMDDWTTPIESGSILKKYSAYTPRLFVSKIGSGRWDTIVPPAKEDIKSLYVDSSGIYIGTYFTGEVWKYDLDNKEWTDLSPCKLKEREGFHVFGISKYKTNLFVSMSGYQDTNVQVYDSIRVLQFLQENSVWIDVTPKKFAEDIKTQFHKGVTLNNKFYAATMYGVWTWDITSRQWKHLPDFPEPHSWFSQKVNDIAVHKGILHAIVSGRVYSFDELAEKWISIDSLHYRGDTTDIRNCWIYTNTPSPTTLISDGEHLFVSGGISDEPYVYMGDYGEPYGNISKGWRTIGSWCKNFQCFQTGGTNSIDIVGDTLYNANWENLLKFPLDKLDSAIADGNDFHWN